MRGGALFVAAALASSLMLGRPALAEQSDFAVGFDPANTSTDAALTLHIVYRDPGNPNGKPSPIRHLAIEAPPGTSINTATRPRCDASDQQIQAQGPSACPSDSRIGSGTLTAITGFGPPVDPFTGTVTIFNDGHGWIEVVQQQGSGATVTDDRIQVDGDTLTGNPPATPGGPPDGQTAVRTIDFTFPRSGGYFTTPSTCPPDGSWTWTAAFTFADGSTQHAQSASGCQPANSGGASSPSPHTATRRLHLSGSPRRVRTGSNTILFRVTAASTHCRRATTVRFAGRRGRTNSLGRVTIRVHLERPGPHRAVATKRGCRAASAMIYVLQSRRPTKADTRRLSR